MPTASRLSAPHRGTANVSLRNGRFDRNLAHILDHATDVFYRKGYEGASMRDLSRASGMSLAGLYYYFESKERLLYLIQKHTFTTILARLRQQLREVSDPEQRIRIFIKNHLEYSIQNEKAMKVLSHEDEALKNGLGAEIAAIKRDYYRVCLGLLAELKEKRGGEPRSRVAVLSLFGMLNWIYTWHNKRVDPDPEELARQMGDIFLHGLAYSSDPRHPKNSSSPVRARNQLARKRRK
jgi:TetR/AcrR family transcriptional regulator, cholesterol catabolism regulator